MIRKLKKFKGEKSLVVSDKNDIEGLFVECIEEVRKEVMRRRIRTEINQKKKGFLRSVTILSEKDLWIDKKE